MDVFWLVVLVAIFCPSDVYPAKDAREVTVSTYNLWNIMFNWEVRKLRIAQMVDEQKSDVVVFQEMRFDKDKKRSQLNEIKKHLKRFRYSASGISGSVSQQKDAIWPGMELEGLAIVSRYKIVDYNVHNIPYHSGPDRNKRIILHVRIEVDPRLIVNLLAVHFSYDRQQQCHNAQEVIKYIKDNNLNNIVLAGDMNTYNDFSSPIELLTHNAGTCLRKQRNTPQFSRDELLSDVASITHKSTGNLTFSNMPKPGLVSRPDRILVSGSMRCLEVVTSGNGEYYRNKYFSSIYIHRLTNLISSAKKSYYQSKGYSCSNDCGPIGSCRCGNCITGGNDKSCSLPQCSECDASVYQTVLIIILILAILFLHFIYATLRVLVTSAYFSQKNLNDYLGCTCCLCNLNLYRRSKQIARRSGWNRVMSLCPQLNVPPMILLVVVIVLSVIFILYIRSSLRDSFININAMMKEEFFPSDHLMLTAYLVVEIND